jgi:hypothetical protein
VAEAVDPGLVRAELLARRDASPSAIERALWCLPLGVPEEGLEILGRVVRGGREVQGNLLGVVAALLVGDAERARALATVALNDLDRYVVGYRDYLGALFALVVGDDAATSAHLEALERAVSGRDKLRSGHPAAVTAISRGLGARDAAEVARGVDAVLSWHVRRARAPSDIFNSAAALVSFDAAFGVLFAHERGMAVDVAPTYRAAALRLMIVATQEWEGRPLARKLPYEVSADLVAGPWLAWLGVALPDAPGAATSPGRVTRSRAPRRKTDPGVSPESVRTAIEAKVDAGLGSPWQLASWSLMLGDVGRARACLIDAARPLERQWRADVDPNPNVVREHFALALVLGEERAQRDTTAVLQRWMAEYERFQPRYGHAFGALDLVCDLLAGRRVERADAARVIPPLASIPVACAGLVERDPELLSEGLDGMLAEHARTLERKTSPPPALCSWSIYIAIAAARVGLALTVDERYAAHEVPIDIRDTSGTARIGRLPCDLLGCALWHPA